MPTAAPSAAPFTAPFITLLFNAEPTVFSFFVFAAAVDALLSNAVEALIAPLAAKPVSPNGFNIPSTSPPIFNPGFSSLRIRSSSLLSCRASESPNDADLKAPCKTVVNGESSISWRILALFTTSSGA